MNIQILVSNFGILHYKHTQIPTMLHLLRIVFVRILYTAYFQICKCFLFLGIRQYTTLSYKDRFSVDHTYIFLDYRQIYMMTPIPIQTDIVMNLYTYNPNYNCMLRIEYYMSPHIVYMNDVLYLQLDTNHHHN